jgi:hypothetical protein
VFGAVASDSTCWRLLAHLDDTGLAAIAAARAAARDVVWAQYAETRGVPFPPMRVAGRELPVLVIGLDASVVVCHSEKELAAATFKGSFGYHPMPAFCDNTGEFLADRLRHGNGGANTPPTTSRSSTRRWLSCPTNTATTPILIGTDTVGCTKGFLTHVQNLIGAWTASSPSAGRSPITNATPSSPSRGRCGRTRSTPTAAP